MINTILFDLDGTLLQFMQDDFVAAYFAELSKVLVRLGLDASQGARAVWAGSAAMVRNDGTALNAKRFWDTFARIMGLSGTFLREVETECDKFYSGDFDKVRRVLRCSDPGLPRRMIDSLKSRGFGVALATNPQFPACAVATRLAWAGLAPDDFLLVTDYSNSTFCKPSLDYYREVLHKLDKQPGECLMVGNNTREDMAAGELGIDTFLVTDFLESEAEADIAVFRHGTLAEAEAYLSALTLG